MNESTPTAAIRVAAFVLLATLCGCGRQPVDAKLVGRWQTAITSSNGPYVVRFTTTASGAYRIDAQSPASAEPETGAFTASGGKWRREKLTGGSDEGTYEVVSADTVLFTSKTDTMLWKRIPSDLAAAAAPLESTSGSSAPAGFGSASGATGGTPPSADLLAAGPFGAPLPPSAAVTAPQSPTNADQFGSAPPAFAPTSPSTASASGSAQARPTTPSTDAASAQSTNVRPSVHDAATQGVASVQHAARKAAADTGAAASDAVNDAAAQTNKRFGQHITGFATNAGSKIKNFFTGHHPSDDDPPDPAPAAPTQKNGH